VRLARALLAWLGPTGRLVAGGSRALLTWLGPTGRLVVGGLALGLATAALNLGSPFGLVELAELKLLDGHFALRGPRAPVTPIVIVKIDEESFDELGAFPWPREIHGVLVDILSEARPLAIGIDVVFPEESRLGPADDRALGVAIERAGNVVLAAMLTESSDLKSEREDINPPVAAIRGASKQWGPAMAKLDLDASVRRTRLLHRHLDRDWESWDLLVLRQAAQRGLRVAPLPDTPDMVINYRGGPFTFEALSYHQVVAGEIDPDAFAGKIVLVGSTSGVLHDEFPTPFATTGRMPGVEIHANVLETLIQGLAIRPQPLWAALVAPVAVSIMMVWAAGTLRPLVATALVAGALVGAFSLAHLAFRFALLWIGIVPSSVALVLGFITTVVSNVLQEQREKRRLSRFLAPAVARAIIRTPDALSPKRRALTVLFSDIRGFTSMSERMAPEQVVKFLQEYLTTMSDAVFLHEGTVDKYVGDAIVALYNAPNEMPDHAARAVRTALEFQERLVRLRSKFADTLGGDIRCGVGIHTGEAVVGELGSAHRSEYTAIGDTMNLGSRLEGLTKRFDVPIIISEATYREVKDQFRTHALGEVGVRGREEPVQVYAVLGPVDAPAQAPPAEAPAAEVPVTEVPAPPATAAADR
jgi:adenylate cyclase